jgi:hypothetical protein
MNDVDKRYTKTSEPPITSSSVRDRMMKLGSFVPKRVYEKGTLYQPYEINYAGTVYLGEWKNG